MTAAAADKLLVSVHEVVIMLFKLLQMMICVFLSSKDTTHTHTHTYTHTHTHTHTHNTPSISIFIVHDRALNSPFVQSIMLISGQLPPEPILWLRIENVLDELKTCHDRAVV